MSIQNLWNEFVKLSDEERLAFVKILVANGFIELATSEEWVKLKEKMDKEKE